MQKHIQTPKNYQGVTLKETAHLVRQHAKNHQWSLGKAADDLISAGAKIRNISTKSNLQGGVA